jgi:putative MFS transporter
MSSATASDLSIGQRMSVLPIGRMHRKIVFAIGVGLFFDLYEIFLAGTIKPVLASTFHVPDSALAWLLGSAFFGMFVGAIAMGRLADRIGRRNAFLLNLGIYSVFSLLSAFSPNAVFLVITRFVAGFGIGAQQPLADTFLSDVLPAQHRGRLSAWAYTCSFIGVPVVGFLALALTPVTAPIPGWRIMFVIGALGAVVILLMQRSLPESPRWLDSVGRRDEAAAALQRFIEDPAAAEAAFAAFDEEPSGTKPPLKRLPLAALMKPPFGKRFGMMVVFHLFQSIGYYGFGTLAVTIQVANGATVSQSLLYTSLGYLGYPLGSLISIPLINRFERKYLLIAATIAMSIVGILYGFSLNPVFIVVFGLIYTLISNVFSNSYHIYQAEIFPTSLRATAASWTYSLSRLSSGVAPFLLLPLLAATSGAVVFLVIAVLMAIIAVDVGVLGPRTFGRSVEDIAPSRE